MCKYAHGKICALEGLIMEEDRKVWVDFERRLYTFLWKVLIPDTQVKLQQFTGKGSILFDLGMIDRKNQKSSKFSKFYY